MGDSIFTFDDEDFGVSDNYAAYPLCVPQDPIDEIELYPNFFNDSISLNRPDFLLEFGTPCDTGQKARLKMRKPVADCNGFLTNKKQRGKRGGRRSMNEVSFGKENEKLYQRKCSHCETTQTPQWRIGPLGPKTLCNACGVRYKSGRLLPEYRPAASPTFNIDVHSNFHKNVIKKKFGIRDVKMYKLRDRRYQNV